MVCVPAEMRRRRITPICLLIGAVAAISSANARPISSFPLEIRKRNYVRLSTETCDECMTMEDFYKHNRLGFVLFFEHALMGGHKYKEAIVNGWMEVCKKLSYSFIACGMVDMLHDRAYAERYIEPKTAPAHIMVRDGQPLMATKEQVDPLLAKPGDKATMLKHVGQLLKDEGSLDSLYLSIQDDRGEVLADLAAKHMLVIVCFADKDQNFADSFRVAVQDAVLSKQEWMSTTVDVDPKTITDGKGRKGKGAVVKEKLRIAFVAINKWPSSFRETAGKSGWKPGAIGYIIAGSLTSGDEQMKATVKPGDVAVSQILERVMGNGRKILKEDIAAKKKAADAGGDKAEL